MKEFQQKQKKKKGSQESKNSGSSSSGSKQIEIPYNKNDDPDVGPRGSIYPVVIPRSSRLIYEDNEYALYSVTVFRHCVKDFAQRARENRFTIRQYTPPKDVSTAGERLVENLKEEKDERSTDLLNFCKEWFKEVFSAWIHLKAIRVFVESVLRYGVPANFDAILMTPKSKSRTKQLRGQLDEYYQPLGSSMLQIEDDDARVAVGGAATRKLYPYVFTEIDIDM